MKNGHRLMTFLAALGFLALAPAAPAATATVTQTWTNPTTYTDNSPLPAADIAGYRYTCTFTPTNGTAGPCTGLAPITAAAGAQASQGFTFTYNGAQGGTACFTIHVRATNGTESDASVPLSTGSNCRVFAPIKPNPATGVTVTVTVAVATPTSR